MFHERMRCVERGSSVHVFSQDGGSYTACADQNAMGPNGCGDFAQSSFTNILAWKGRTHCIWSRGAGHNFEGVTCVDTRYMRARAVGKKIALTLVALLAQQRCSDGWQLPDGAQHARHLLDGQHRHSGCLSGDGEGTHAAEPELPILSLDWLRGVPVCACLCSGRGLTVRCGSGLRFRWTAVPAQR